MVKKFVYLGLIIAFTSCKNNKDIFKNFNCHSNANLSDTEIVLDAKNNFSLSIPKYWKTELYLDENSSMFTTADTTKQYQNTYLIKTTLIASKLTLNKFDIAKIKASILTDKNTKLISESQGTFKNWPALLLRSKSDKFKSGVSVLHLYAPISDKQYFEIEIHCFGPKNIDKRFCEAISIINSLKTN
jgi:hypothetical protein